jgi:hypothetical protein
MINTNRIITLDLEGDGLKKEINQKLFPTGCHFDPNTRIWCATFTTRVEGIIRTVTYVSKLNGTRPVYVKDANGNDRMAGMTTAEHYASTVIPTEVNSRFGHHKIISCDTIIDLVKKIITNLGKLAAHHEIWIKGYNGYKYDQIALFNSLYKLLPNLDESLIVKQFNDVFDVKFRDASKEFPKLQVNWPGTTEQVQIGDLKDNQTYMNTGIIHNIEDSYQLFTMVERYAKEANAEERIKGDF